MTLKEAKDRVARKYGFCNWGQMTMIVWPKQEADRLQEALKYEAIEQYKKSQPLNHEQS